MRASRTKIALAGALLIGAAGCELVAGLEDHTLVNETSDSATNDSAPNEAAASAAFTIANLPALTIQQGANSAVQVTITRTGGFTDAINVTVSGLPAGASTNPLSITGDLTSGTLTFVTSATTPQGTAHLSIDGVSADGKTSASAKMDLIVRGTPGALDVLYGDQGSFTTKSLIGNGATLDANDNVIVSGVIGSPATQFGSMRILPSGAVDTTFAGGLLALTPAGAPTSFPFVTSLSTNNLLYAGALNAGSFEYFRTTSTGAFDLTYSADGGGPGYVDPNPSASFVPIFTADSSGRIIAFARGFGSPEPLYVERRTPLGAPDSTFTAGSHTLGTGDDQVRVAIVQKDGKPVAACYASDTAGVGFALARFTDTGALDATFGTSGYVAPKANALGNPYALLQQPDGKLLIVAASAFSFITRYNTDGSEDTTFGASGVTTVPHAFGMALQSDGKIVLLSAALNTLADGGVYTSFGLERITSSGAVDTTFGAAGFVSTNFGDPTYGGAQPINVLVQSDGKIVVVGYANLASGEKQLTVARYWP